MAFFRGAAVDRLGEKKNKQSAGMTPHFTLFKGHPATSSRIKNNSSKEQILPRNL